MKLLLDTKFDKPKDQTIKGLYEGVLTEHWLQLGPPMFGLQIHLPV